MDGIGVVAKRGGYEATEEASSKGFRLRVVGCRVDDQPMVLLRAMRGAVVWWL